MKKIVLSVLLVCFCVSLASAQLLVGGRGAGMGGTGVASARGLDAAYYNPACLMRSDVLLTEIKINLGAKYTDVTTLSNALAKAKTPAELFINNYTEAINFQGDLAGVTGINFRRVGLSVVPNVTGWINKSANSFTGSAEVGGHYDPTLTLGTTFSLPYLPGALDVGVNVKAISTASGSIELTTTGITGRGTQTIGTGSGLGFDLGFLTSFDLPLFSKFAVGAVMRNVSASYTLKTTTSQTTLEGSTITYSAETNLPDQKFNLDSSTAIGAYGTIPGIGLGVAVDYDIQKSGSYTHVGLEYPLLLDTFILRAGLASGPGTNLTTYGAELDFRLISLAICAANDANNSGHKRVYADITIGL